MPKLGVNVDHVATLRQARRGVWPSPVEAALLCEEAGCHSIVAHLREDRRHIQDEDIRELRRQIRTRLNLEMATAPDVVALACELRPHQATLVPEKREELTTEGGLNVVGDSGIVAETVRRLKESGITVSLFIDPVREQIEASARIGADCVEFHTGRYADALSEAEQVRCFGDLERAVSLALDSGLVPHAGHGLRLDNVIPVARIQGVDELNIGYSIVCRSIFVGLEAAVKEMVERIQ
ncbi:MAG: pyridoxine 5'-phosphate synthase [Candidatus Omnitrophica bacterium]|nr:pyridoxine 5'-phosphate synthase [Candidatus Omnitrophota bacterium]